jgi:hypothetical protein
VFDRKLGVGDASQGQGCENGCIEDGAEHLSNLKKMRVSFSCVECAVVRVSLGSFLDSYNVEWRARLREGHVSRSTVVSAMQSPPPELVSVGR